MRDTAFDSGSTEDWATRNAAVLDSIFEGAAFGLAVLDRDLRFVRVNGVMAQVNGVPVSGHTGRALGEVLASVPEQMTDAIRSVLETGEAVHDVEVAGPSDDGLGQRTLECSYHPIVEHGETVGVWFWAREITTERRAAAIEQRRRFALEHELESEHRIATELQVSLMPDRLPEVLGADVASGFRPAGDGYEIGGDFFDVFPLDERCSMVLIGDVCGKGAEAASLTALARYTLRAAAIQEGAKPCTLLTRLNEAIRRQRDDLRFLTCVCAFVRPGDAGALGVTACVAGHPPPLRVHADGGVTKIGGHGTLVGAWDDPRFAQEAFELLPGERLVLYTDGVTEAGAPRDELTEDGLVELLATQPQGSSAGTVAAIERAVVARTEGPHRDDVAVLVLRPKP